MHVQTAGDRVFVMRAATLQRLGSPRLQCQPCLQCERRRRARTPVAPSQAAVQTHLIINSQPGCSAPPPVTLTFHNPDIPPSHSPLYTPPPALSLSTELRALPAEQNPANRSDSLFFTFECLSARRRGGPAPPITGRRLAVSLPRPGVQNRDDCTVPGCWTGVLTWFLWLTRSR